MKILFLGDVFGKCGRNTVKKILPDLRKKIHADMVIANIENMSHGKGFSPEQVSEMQASGVDFFTSGNHVWKDKSGVAKLPDSDFPVLRPANYPNLSTVPGRGYEILHVKSGRGTEKSGVKVGVVNLMGRVFMKDHLDCPFRKFDEIFDALHTAKVKIIFVDFHAEATSEKVAFAYYLDSRASAVIGTHTHVATRDERILPGGTAFMSDVGFIGPIDSIIGMQKESVIRQFLTQMPQKHEPAEAAEGGAIFNSVLISVDPQTGKAKKIEYIGIVV